MDLVTALEKYDQIVANYESISFDDVNGTTVLMKDMSICLSYLTMERVGFQKMWNAAVFTFKGTNAAGEKYANEQYPQLYRLRRIHEAGKTIIDTMRSHVNLLKQEK